MLLNLTVLGLSPLFDPFRVVFFFCKRKSRFKQGVTVEPDMIERIKSGHRKRVNPVRFCREKAVSMTNDW